MTSLSKTVSVCDYAHSTRNGVILSFDWIPTRMRLSSSSQLSSISMGIRRFFSNASQAY
ncbi:hypothetical protein K443DRAFT_686985 [Laccaria amethystina LaAM-08-1]|uniref:Unplaced genomic scaffold K443scaffold_771, whole genome shotgun sequence n=1 Tax=Laccaria amethystina LaAM-08-1 TaxID=1095629 RepID=A0A0C9WGU4_9AGAR|nr:hypothetical protein K443DRAFT_686985 [Laccaria amethystina LaAM-08-1]